VIRYSLRRLLASIPVLLVASLLVFWAVRLTFDPTAKLATSREGAAARAELRARLGLDRPIIVQWWDWLTSFVRGDWGTSSRTGDQVLAMTGRAFGYTLQLIIWGFLVAAVISILIGVYSAVRQYSVGDYVFTGLSYLGLAMPPFWFGLIAIQLLAVGPKKWFGLDEPLFGFIGLGESGVGFSWGYVKYLVLPVLTLTVQIIASWSRYQRASMLDVLGSDYVRTAKAKGLPRRKVVFKHAFRNALIPLVTVMAIDAGALFGGLIITEYVFSIPGMGRFFIDALQAGDVNAVLAWMVVSAFFVILFNLLADLAYGWLDPRIRLT
jgi:peptide/nickel transport system permease protein